MQTIRTWLAESLNSDSKDCKDNIALIAKTITDKNTKADLRESLESDLFKAIKEFEDQLVLNKMQEAKDINAFLSSLQQISILCIQETSDKTIKECLLHVNFTLIAFAFKDAKRQKINSLWSSGVGLVIGEVLAYAAGAQKIRYTLDTVCGGVGLIKSKYIGNNILGLHDLNEVNTEDMIINSLINIRAMLLEWPKRSPKLADPEEMKKAIQTTNLVFDAIKKIPIVERLTPAVYKAKMDQVLKNLKDQLRVLHPEDFPSEDETNHEQRPTTGLRQRRPHA